MQTRVIQNFSLAVAALKRGEPVVFPTETVYGLGAPIFCEAAVRQVFAIKGRPSDNPLIAHIANVGEAERLGESLGIDFYALAEAFWPGPLAIVVKKRAEVPDIVSGGGPTIAIRMPAHGIARQLIEAVGEPLVAPSANLSGRPSPTCVRDVLEDLEGKVHWVIDGGPCGVGIESTVVSLFHKEPTLLRPGKITRSMLEEVLGCSVALPSLEGPIYSPGMKYRHYAPRAKVKLVFEKEKLEGPFLMPTQKTLYAQLRELDRAGVDVIQIYCDSAVQKDEGLMNRLLRAAGKVG